MISSISEKGRSALFLLLVACSSAPPSMDLENRALENELKTLDAPEKEVSYGPTRNEGNDRFVDVTAEYGLEGVEGVTFAAIDLNRDLFSDLVVLPNYFSEPRIFLFDPVAKKYRASEQPLFSEPVQASFVVFADFNNDDIPDAFTAVLNQRGEFTKFPIRLWYGYWDAGQLLRFKPADKFLNLPPEPTSTIVPLDVNLDGRLDLFVGNWYEEKRKVMLPVADRLLLNFPSGWVDQSSWLAGERTKNPDDIYPPNAKPTYGASSCDVDQDGWPDILVATSGGHYNKLWMNRGSGQNDDRIFRDVAKEAGFAADPQGILVPTGGGRTFTAICADYNDDGLMDVYLGELTHGWDNLSVDRSSVLTGSRPGFPPSFLRTEYMSEVSNENWNQGDKRAMWADINLDGLVDLVVDNTGFPPQSRLVIFSQDESRAFANNAVTWGADVVNPSGSILLDINQDGKLDILTGQFNIRQASMKNRLYLLENHLNTGKGRAVTFHLQGGQEWGAMVMLYTLKDGKQVIQRRWLSPAQGGIPSQLPSEVHFGVGEDTKVVGVKVRWPVLDKINRRNGMAVERLYSIEDEANKPLQTFTLCETGKATRGRFNCK